jgi:hypothetical protein
MTDLLHLLSQPRPTEADLTARVIERQRRTDTLNGARVEADERYDNGDDKDAFIAGALWNAGFSS